MEVNEIVEVLKQKPYMMEMGAGSLAKRLNTTREIVYQAKQFIHNEEDYQENNIDIINNMLIIGDLHAPFIRKGYLSFCKRMYEK